MNYYFSAITSDMTGELVAIAVAREDREYLLCINRSLDRQKLCKANLDLLQRLPLEHDSFLVGKTEYTAPNPCWMPHGAIGPALIRFVGVDEFPVFIGHQCSEAWSSVLKIFGGSYNTPHHFPRYAVDIASIRQFVIDQSDASIAEPEYSRKSHLLEEARDIRNRYLNLKRFSVSKPCSLTPTIS
ncbi:hypothetical protein [Chroococcidiopsis sp.]|uniref:hypothetical protein n=1 Tax=Chroococcidiopsis sp. TaxID=3088168 RepID=UPI003F3CBA5B